jgi:hypothetical protein
MNYCDKISEEEFERNKKLQNNKGSAADDENNNVSVTKENGH